MPRCKKKRCCRKLDGEKIFKPISIPLDDTEIVEIDLDEFEAVRLCDLEGKSQIEASETMEISRGTIQRLLESSRRKIVYALLHSCSLKIKDQE